MKPAADGDVTGQAGVVSASTGALPGTAQLACAEDEADYPCSLNKGSEHCLSRGMVCFHHMGGMVSV